MYGSVGPSRSIVSQANILLLLLMIMIMIMIMMMMMMMMIIPVMPVMRWPRWLPPRKGETSWRHATELHEWVDAINQFTSEEVEEDATLPQLSAKLLFLQSNQLHFV